MGLLLILSNRRGDEARGVEAVKKERGEQRDQESNAQACGAQKNLLGSPMHALPAKGFGDLHVLTRDGK